MSEGHHSLLFFLHIPKTAGTTLRGVLEAEYGDGIQALGNMFKGSGGVDESVFEALIEKEIRPNATLLTGHVPYAAVEFFSEETRNFTVLRDPVERTISHYYFLAEQRERELRGERAKSSRATRTSTDLKGALASGVYFPDNLQTRMLAVDPAVGDPCTESMLKQAKRNLSKCATFGLVERFDETLALFAQTFGWRAPLYRARARTTANRPRAADLSAADREAIVETTRFDRELYDYAAKQFAKKIEAQDEHFEFELTAMQAAQCLIQQGDWPARGHPQRGDVFGYRVHQLCAEYELLEERERIRFVKGRLVSQRRKIRDLTKQNEMLTAELEDPKNAESHPAADGQAEGELLDSGSNKR